MSDKEKQIEEISKCCCNACEMSWGCDLEDCAEHGKDGYKRCGLAKETAEMIYNAGYRKIPEGAVVLTREEQDKILKATEKRIKQLKEENGQLRLENNDLEAENDKLKNFNDKLSQGIYYGNGEQFCNRLYQARKETAREILNEWADCDKETGGFNLPHIYELAKRYGVEVEE